MHIQNISFSLPTPWTDGHFQTNKLGYINFLVGPNGSGKSRFASLLKNHLANCRLLGTDRLSGMEQNAGLRNIFGDHFPTGFAKQQFDNFKNAGQQGLGIDTIVLLEERLDLRMQVEATLSHLFDRRISLEWDSGHLQAKASIGSAGSSYRLDRDECHGIKELFVLLTHLYNDECKYLIIDEPELNLHPQYQAFFLQEVRKVAGPPTPGTNKKIIFLITHSPFILDFRSIDDVKSVISFSSSHLPPKQLLDLDENAATRLASLVPRLNVHHKQLFFADNPIFVEGILDAQMLATLQESRGVSVAGAGSCIIDAGGCEEVNRYLELCLALGKQAHFVYDLDSLFSGNLRACVRGDDQIQHFLAAAGVGSDFSRYCGELDRALTSAIGGLLALPTDETAGGLLQYLGRFGARSDWSADVLAKGRVAVLTAISRFRDDMLSMLGAATVSELEGRLMQIGNTLRQRNVHLLSGGTLERYLPGYTGQPYEIRDDLKRTAVSTEVTYLSSPRSDEELRQRYGSLFDTAELLPSKVRVNIDTVLKDYLSRYIHDLQSAIVANPSWDLQQLRSHLSAVQKSASRVFSITIFQRNHLEFQAQINVISLLGFPPQIVNVTHRTNAGMRDFELIS